MNDQALIADICLKNSYWKKAYHPPLLNSDSMATSLRKPHISPDLGSPQSEGERSQSRAAIFGYRLEYYMWSRRRIQLS